MYKHTPQLSEAVIAYSNRESGQLWQQLFQRPYFAINLLADVPGAEMCGTLKNIVAVGAGIGDGLGVGECGCKHWWLWVAIIIMVERVCSIPLWQRSGR